MTQDTEPDPTGNDHLLVHARVILRFEDPERCRQAQAALTPESEGFLQITPNQNELHLSVPQGTPARILATLDDTIACLQAAEASRDASRGTSRRL